MAEAIYLISYQSQAKAPSKGKRITFRLLIYSSPLHASKQNRLNGKWVVFTRQIRKRESMRKQ